LRIGPIDKAFLYTHLVEPYPKGVNLFKKAWAPVPWKERAVCVLQGCLLLIPIINTIISIASKFFAKNPPPKPKSLETGLRGLFAGICVTSAVDPIKGVSYAGHPIALLAHKDPIEVIYLLYHGKIGSTDQIAKFQQNLIQRAPCKQETIDAITLLAAQGHAPMELFSMALLAAKKTEGTVNYREDCLNIIAKLPQIVACIINAHAKWGPTPPPKPELGYMENFVHMLNVPDKDPSRLTEVMRLFNILHYDHSGANLSAFVGKAIASGRAGMHGSLAGAMEALAGPLHGGANTECLQFVTTVQKQVEPNARAVENLIRSRLAKKEVIFGFGHAILRVPDPRATVCYDYCQKHFATNPLVKIASLLRTEGSKVLKESPKISNPYPNIDAITGTMLTAAGFPYPDYYTLLFGLSRCVGIASQIVYERTEALGGKGTPMVRPTDEYVPRELAAAKP